MKLLMILKSLLIKMYVLLINLFFHPLLIITEFATIQILNCLNHVNLLEEHDFLGMKTCTVGVKFKVTHQMAPLSRLLVYYVRPNGEGVADALRFNVKPKFKNRVSIKHMLCIVCLMIHFVKIHVVNG